MAEEIGLRAPIYTATGWNAKYGAAIPEYDVLPVFGGYPEAPWEAHTEKLEPNIHYFFLKSRNDSGIGKDLLVQDADETEVFKMRYELYPYATCELGGGVQVTHHRRPVMGEKDISAISLVKLGCGNNLLGYYMYHGGTNDISRTTLQESKETGYPNDYPIRSYDFQAPLGEYGEVRESYHQLRELHLFVRSFMGKLAPMDTYFPEKISQIKWIKQACVTVCVQMEKAGSYLLIIFRDWISCRYTNKYSLKCRVGTANWYSLKGGCGLRKIRT